MAPQSGHIARRKDSGFTYKGDIYTVPVAGGTARQLTTNAAHDTNPVWSPDGKSIAYISDATGETEIWLKDADGSTPRQLTKGNDTYIRALQWTPDSRRIIYTDRKNRVVSVDPASGAKTVLFTNPEHEMRGIDVSPDSRWIAYSRSGANQMGVIYVRSLADGKEYPRDRKMVRLILPDILLRRPLPHLHLRARLQPHLRAA